MKNVLIIGSTGQIGSELTMIALGLPFDPEMHSAVMQQPAAEGQESGTVVQVFQKGYKLGDKVVRHATVVVAE